MEGHRKSLLNKCVDRISELKIFMKNDDDMINGIKNLGDTAYVRAQVNKYEAKHEERIKEIKELEEKVIKIPQGLLDDEINAVLNNNIKEQEEKQRIRTEKLKEKQEYKAEKSVKSTAFYQTTRISDREARYETKDMGKGYNHFIKACNSIPEYMLTNLKNMPGNKGYFWKNVACYGELPRERGQPTTLFEKKGGGIMLIHEWTPTEYNVYSKNDKDRKRLISSDERKLRRR